MVRLACALLLLPLLIACSDAEPAPSSDTDVMSLQTANPDAAPAADSLLRHVVLFRFKEGTSDAELREVEAAFNGLPGQIDVIRDYEWGVDSSPEGLAQGYTHCYFLTFASAADRDAYLPHPAHKRFGEVVGPHIDAVLVVDYWTRGVGERG